MAIYDLGTASLAANGEVTGVGTTWKAPLTLIRVGATIVFKTEPVKIYTISEIISDTHINVYNPNSETVPAGTGYAILAHDGITVQGLAQDVAETLRYYQSRETEVSAAVDIFKDFDQDKFSNDVSQVNTQFGEIVTIGAQVSADSAKVSNDVLSSQVNATNASSAADRAEAAANSVSGVLTLNFSDGGTVESTNQQVLYINGSDVRSYVWTGSLPKTIPADSTPDSTGGVEWGAWVCVGYESLSSPSGITHVGNGYGYYDTITTATASQFKDGMLVTFKGRDVANDGGGGVFRYTSDETLEANGGTVFSVSGGGRLIRQVQTSLSENQISEAINVRWFGAKGDAATDDTASILNAYNFAKSTSLFYTLLFPAGRYVTLTSFIFQDVTNCSFVMDGAVFIGGSNGADNSQQAVFEVRNVVDASISGPWSVTTKPQTGPLVNNPNAYISGFLVRGVPGGVLQPELGICAFFSVSDLTTIRIGNGIRVGEINNDAQTSEMQFVNCKTPATVNPVQVSGSQTLVSFVGCTLASNTVDRITNAQKVTIINNGGAVSIEGGSVEQHSDSSTRMILMGPCFSPTYGNPYGQVAISGSVIETIAPICDIVNSFSYSSPASYNSKLSIIGCTGGYIGSVPETSSLINVFDTEYAGVIAIPDGSLFYAQLGSPKRDGYNVNASGNSKVRIVVGKTVFDTATGLKGYQSGVAGGLMIHPEVLATEASVTSQSIPASTNTVIVWGSNPEDSVRMGRYHYIVNTSTGEITIPDAGIKSMRIEVTAALDSPSINGNIILYRNGALSQYGVMGGGVGLLNATISDPVPGEIVTIRLNISETSTLTNITKMKVYLTT